MKNRKLAAAVLTAIAAFGIHGAEAKGRAGLRMTALTADQTLVTYAVNTPVSTPTGPARAIAGLSGGDTALVGIDYRPANGALYGLGNNGGVYTVDAATGIATLVSRLYFDITLDGVTQRIDVVPVGNAFGVDFNPLPDRLRVVSNTGQNLRINVDTGLTILDRDLEDLAQSKVNGIVAAAYTNSDAVATTGTMLFTIDSSADMLNLQNPPNAGTQVPIGALGVDAVGDAGFDIQSSLGADGAAISNTGYATLATPDGGVLYTVDVLTGAATRVSKLAAGASVVDIAFPIGQ